VDDQSAPSEAGEPYDPQERVRQFMAWLETWGKSAIPTTIIPPMDHDALVRARRQAERAAAATGRLDDLRRQRRAVVDWALATFRRSGLTPIYFGGHSAPAPMRAEAVDVLTDALAGYLLADVLPDDTTLTLFARLDILLGGQLFPLDPEPS
jgi:hypothetical protein